jgi:broad specificity phosphatase PhoE
MSEPHWPRELILVRHGQSAGNVARDRAIAEGLTTIDIKERDCDVPLSRLGERQSRALGEWLSSREERPHVVLASPYVRAGQTAEIAIRAAGFEEIPIVSDERLREKEFGILDRLTRSGIEEKYPDQAAMLTSLGKFYFRPPGGESWTDVILRLRSLLDTLSREHRGQRVLVVSHQVIVLCFRYLLERMTESELLAIDKRGDVANCAITRYVYDEHARPEGGGLRLVEYNTVVPMEEAGEPVTRGADVPVAPK